MDIMSQPYRRQKNGKTSSTTSEPKHQQENGNDRISEFILKCPAMFALCGVIAVLCVDPLFFYLPVINQDHKCLALDGRLKITAICLRVGLDLVYVANVILGFLFPYKNKNTEFVTDATEIRKKYLRYYFPIDILVILPIPQILVPFIFTKMATSSNFMNIRMVINLFLLLQYVPRVLRIYLSWKRHIKGSKLYHREWIKASAAFNIFFYIISSHVLGGLWYFFSIQQEMACWHKTCKKHTGCTSSSFKCGRNSGNYTFLYDACPIYPPNTTLFDFGIFQNALESGIVSSTNISQKLMLCFWWGLRNLSSFGQNLQTSTDFGENCFAIFISICGLLLFLYFIGNAQTLMQMATEKKAKDEHMEAEKTED